MPGAMIAATLLVAFVDRMVIPSLLWLRDGLITFAVSPSSGLAPPHLPIDTWADIARGLDFWADRLCTRLEARTGRGRAP